MFKIFQRQTSNRKTTLGSLLTGTFVGLLIIALLVMSIFQLIVSFQAHQNEVAARQELAAQAAADEVADFLDAIFTMLQGTIISNPLAQAAPAQQSLLDKLLAFQPALTEVALFDAAGQELVKTSRLNVLSPDDLADRSGEELFQTVAQGERYIGPVEVNEQTSEPQVTMAVPLIDVFGEFQGGLVAQVNLKSMWDLVDSLQVGQTGVAYVVDNQGRLIAFKDVSRVLRGETVTQLVEVAEFLEEGTDEETGEIGIGIEGRYVVGALAPLHTADWAVVTELPVTEAYRDVLQTIIILLVILVGIAVLAGFAARYLARRLAVPVLNLTGTATRIAAGESNLQAPAEGPAEVVQLSEAFNSMTYQLNQTLTGLQNRTRDLDLAARVSRRLSSVRNLDTLLAEAVELIQSEFNLYYVQVYLTAAGGRSLVLRTGSGAVGRQLQQRGHRLPLGPGSINGTAAAEKQPVIVADTAESETFLPNPLLPDTRSEMAIPLIVGERVVGVLNLQHNQPETLTKENLPIFEALAGQLAIAIDNARLFTETEQARAETEAYARRLTGQGWAEYLNAIDHPERLGFSYAQDSSLNPLDEALEGTATEGVLAVPVAVSGEPVGTIQLKAEAERAWTADETELVSAVARQVSQQVENLRLLAQADRYRAEAEAAVRRTTREGWVAYIDSLAALSTGFVYDLNEVMPLNNEANDHQTSLSRPINVHGETIGELAVDGIEQLDDEATELLSIIAEQLSDHIENARLLEETERGRQQLDKRAVELQTVAEVSTTASTILDSQILLQTVVDQVKESFNLYHAHIYLLDAAGESLVLTAGAGEVGRQMVAQGWEIPLDREQSLVARAARSRQGVIVNDVYETPDFLPNELLPETRSEMAIPIISGDKVLGVLDVQSQLAAHFNVEDANIQTTLAGQIATALENARLFEETQQGRQALEMQAYRLAVLNELGDALAQTSDLNDIFAIVAAKAEQIIAYANRISITILNETGDGLELYAIQGEKAILTDMILPLDKTITGAVLKENRFIVVNTPNAADSERWFDYGKMIENGLQAIAVAPLVVGGQVIGTLNFGSRTANIFGREEEDYIRQITALLASTLENRRLFEQIQEQAARLAVLNEISEELSRTTTTNEVYKVVAVNAKRLIDENRASVALLNEAGDALEVLPLDGELGAIASGVMLPVAGTLVGWVVQENRLLNTPDTRTSDMLDAAKLAENGLLSTIIAPLITNKQVVGSLNFGSKKVNAFTQQDEDIVTRLAALLASTLENRQLLEETQKSRQELAVRSRELEASQQVTFAASETNNPDELLGIVVNLIRDQFDLYHAQVYIVDEEKQAAVLRESTGYAGRQLLKRQHQIPLENVSLVTRAIEAKESIFVPDVNQAEDWLPNDLLPHTQAELVVPLKIDNKVLGALDIQSRTVGQLTERSITLFQTMTDQIAFLFENTELLTRITHQAEAVRAANERFGLAQKSVSLGVWDWDVVNNVLVWDEGMYNLYGIKAEDFGGAYEAWRQGLHPADEIPSDAAIQDALAGTKDFDIEFRVVHPDGSIRHLKANAIVIRDERSAPTRMVGINYDITERKQAEEALRENEAQLSEAQSIARLGRWSWVPSTGEATWSELSYQILDISPDVEASFDLYLEKIHVDDQPAVQQALSKSFEADTNEVAFEHRLANGRYVAVLGAITRDDKGQALRLAGTMQDITERKQAEDAIKDLARHNETILNSAGEGIFGLDDEGRHTFVNPTAAQLLGYEAEDLIGQPSHALWHHTKADGTPYPDEECPIYATYKDGVVHQGEEMFWRKDGTSFPVTYTSNPIRNEDGDLIGAVIGFQDITERKQAEVERQQLLNQTRTLYHISESINEQIDLEGTLQVLANQLHEEVGFDTSWIALFDETNQSLTGIAGTGVGMTPDIIAGSYSIQQDTSNPAVIAYQTGRPVIINSSTDKHFAGLSDEVKILSGKVLEVPIISGSKTLGVMAVSYQSPAAPDITQTNVDMLEAIANQAAIAIERARLFEEIQETAERLREVDQLKSEFLANMSHELRTPLNSIIGYSEMMLMGISGEMPEEITDDIQAIYDNGKHLLALISDILDLAKIEAGRLKLRFEEVSVGMLLDEIQTANAGLFMNKPIELIVDAEKDLPAISADPIRINQILNNLISNAAKFTPEGQVTVRAFQQDQWISLAVEDTGVGMAKEDLQNIFEKFMQVDGSFTRRAEGTGLGLAITRHLIQMHNGEIDVQSELGQGTTFTVRLPITKTVDSIEEAVNKNTMVASPV